VVSRTRNPVACNACRAPKSRAKRKAAPPPDGPAASPARPPKRARNLAKSGRTSDMERDVARAFVDAWTEACGSSTAKVMNDNTKSDAIVRLTAEEDAWRRLQLKTTSGNLKGSPNTWAFGRVTGYSGMLVVYWRCDKGDAWVFDGAKLDERGKLQLAVTPGKKNCKLALARCLNLAELVRYLAALARQGNADLWPTVTEDEARNEFKSGKHEREHLGIVAYKESFPGPRYDYPEGQGTHVDLVKVETRDDGTQVTTRQQFKTARERPRGVSGFSCNLFTSAGRYEGKWGVQPYPEDAFDELVAVAWVKNKAGKENAEFWVIPAEALRENGYLRSKSGDVPGKMVLQLHSLEIGKQPKQNPRKQANTWMRKYRVRELCVRD